MATPSATSSRSAAPECWTQSLAPIGQRVFDLGRHLRVDDPPHHPVVFHLAKLLDQHLLGNRGNRPLQLREPQDLPTEQMKRIKSFHRPSRTLNACSTFRAAVTGVYSLLFCKYLTFLCVLAIR
jgi:hypothetical protein